MDVKDKVIEIVAETLEVSASEVTTDSSVGDFPTWDSLGHMNLLQNIQDEFDIELDPEEIIELEDVNDIIAIVEKKLA